jgi:hypothetical protein
MHNSTGYFFSTTAAAAFFGIHEKVVHGKFDTIAGAGVLLNYEPSTLLINFSVCAIK